MAQKGGILNHKPENNRCKWENPIYRILGQPFDIHII